MVSHSESLGGIEASSEQMRPFAGVRLNCETYDIVVENWVVWFPEAERSKSFFLGEKTGAFKFNSDLGFFGDSLNYDFERKFKFYRLLKYTAEKSMH